MTSLLLLILAGQVVYVGSINPAHLPLARLYLEAGKAVLCEKPLAINLRETRQLVQLARDKGVFLMEAIWSRCIPAYKVMSPTVMKQCNSFYTLHFLYQALKDAIDADQIGEVKQVVATFGRF